MDRKTLEKRFVETDIYPVITPGFCGGRSPLVVLEAVLVGGAKVVQLRDKELPERYAAEFRQLTERYEALFVMNDSVDLALQFQADGVHLGEEDISVAEARQKLPDLLIGASVRDLDQALAAEADGASYVVFGPIFSTRTKKQPGSFLGPEVINDASQRLKIPFGVIGGINQKNIGQVVYAGARHVAMITAITEAEDVEATTAQFVKLIRSRLK